MVGCGQCGLYVASDSYNMDQHKTMNSPICHSSVTMIKCCTQKRLVEEKVYSGIWFQRAGVHSGRGARQQTENAWKRDQEVDLKIFPPHTREHTDVHTHSHVHACAHTLTCIYMYTHVHTHMFMNVHADTHSHVHTCAHRHTHREGRKWGKI